MIAPIINSLIPLGLCILTGFVLKHQGFLSAKTWQQLDRLNYYLLFPALLFLNLATADMNLAKFALALSVVLAVLLLASIAIFVAHRVFDIHPQDIGVYMQSAIRFNTYVGLALVASLFDEAGMVIFSLIIALFIPPINVISVIALSLQHGFDARLLLMNVLKNPLIVACALALAFNASSLTLMAGVEGFFGQLASASLPLGLLCIGAGLQFRLKSSELGIIIANSLIRLLCMPVLAYALCTMMGVVGIERQIITLFFALPTAPTAFSLTQALGGNHPLMANIISMQTLLAMLTLPVILWLVL
ncbi:AEC family transporter [Moraxella porci]|uniref:Transporter n=1 Tax=Moraxella porci DSM 25326 TaxID=573983 RepID=A0A1T0CUZ9_9GAMM|nr:AEC family transporter [Moraxella porci]MDH2273825.1 AEC family transporter [Moraxella porci]OOS26163.1 hypothetical protein B0681_03225 [Moraxella porci DSM 25326]